MNIIVCVKQVPAKDAPLAIAGNWSTGMTSIRFMNQMKKNSPIRKGR